MNLDYNSIEARDYILSQALSEEESKRINNICDNVKEISQSTSWTYTDLDRLMGTIPAVKSIQKDLQKSALNLNNFIEIYPKGNWTEVAIDIRNFVSQAIEKFKELLDLMEEALKRPTVG